MNKLVSIKRELSPKQALLKVKEFTKRKDLELVFCRDYGDSFLLFVRAPGENKESVGRNPKAVNKRTGKVMEWKESDLAEKPWVADYSWGDRIWGTMQ